jgi:hypothetical protein
LKPSRKLLQKRQILFGNLRDGFRNTRFEKGVAMKTAISLIILTGLVLSLVACADNAGQATPEAGLPIASQLVVGTFRLEGTELAVTPEQAAGLLVLWQVYVDLGKSDTAAQVEMDALVEQVQETLTAQQMAAIADMQMTQQDLSALLAEQGGVGSSARAGSDGDTSTANSGAGGFAPPDGGMTGDPPDGGIMPGGGAEQPASASQGGETGAGAGPAGGAGVPTALVEALIRLLEQRASL